MDPLKVVEEIWKPIPGYPGYEASSLGNVRHVRLLHKRAFLARGDKLYVKTDLGRKNKGQFVHRLVALAFHGEPTFEKAQVDHLDADGTNNNPTNLEWVTALENITRKWKEKGAA